MNVIPTVGILVFKDDQVLLVKHGAKASHVTGAYGLPAGRLEVDEKPVAAAVRELFEETGFVCSENDLVELPLHFPPADIPRKDGTIKRFSITIFYCKKYSGKLVASGETTPEWVAVSDIEKLHAIINTKSIVEKGLQEIKTMNKSRISIMVAVDEKGGIGRNNDLLFKIKDDMKRLRSLTNGHPLVMGRKTFDSFPGMLPNRTHVVVTRNPDVYKNAAVKPHYVVSSVEEGIAQAKKAPGSDEIFVFGGGQIFKEAIEKDLVDRLYITVVKGDYHADTFFPPYAQFTKVIEQEDHEADGYTFTFLTLEK